MKPTRPASPPPQFLSAASGPHDDNARSHGAHESDGEGAPGQPGAHREDRTRQARLDSMRFREKAHSPPPRHGRSDRGRNPVGPVSRQPDRHRQSSAFGAPVYRSSQSGSGSASQVPSYAELHGPTGHERMHSHNILFELNKLKKSKKPKEHINWAT